MTDDNRDWSINQLSDSAPQAVDEGPSPPTASIPVRTRTFRPPQDLWTDAIRKLPEKEIQCLESSKVAPLLVLDCVLDAVNESRSVCAKKQWKIKGRNGQSIFVRDILEKIVGWVAKFQSLGDAIAQIDTAHAAAPWAAIRLLLQTAINGVQVHAAVIEALEIVARRMTLFAKVEELYMNKDIAQQDELERRMIEVYCAILSCLARAVRHFRRSTLGRLASGIVQSPGDVEADLDKIESKAQTVYELIRLVDASSQARLDDFMRQGIKHLGDQIGGLGSKLDNMKTDFDLDRIRQWLQPVMISSHMESACSTRTPNTCDWITKHHSFRNWMDTSPQRSNGRLLWIRGGPGSGKTILCAAAIQHLQSSNQHHVAYHFCSDEDRVRNKPTAIIRSWVAQLIESSQETLLEASRICRASDSPNATDEEVWKLLRRLCSSLLDCVFVVDAFDQCSDAMTSNGVWDSRELQRSFLKKLSEVVASFPGHWLFVSREDSELTRFFQQGKRLRAGDFIEHEISTEDVGHDLELFAVNAVSEALPNKDPDLKREIAVQLLSRAQGSFLGIRLLSSQLNADNSRRELRKIVENMPTDIEHSYDRDMQRITRLQELDRTYTIAMLFWIHLAMRPLTVRELLEAVAIETDSNAHIYPLDNLPDTWAEDEAHYKVRRLCGSLITIRSAHDGQEPENQTVHFVHSTVRDCLLRKTNQPGGLLSDPSSAIDHDQIAQICLRYLLFDDISGQSPPTSAKAEDELIKFGLLRYAAKYWHVHAGKCQVWSTDLADLVTQYFDPKAMKWVPSLALFQRQYLDEGHASTSFSIDCGSERSPLYFAAMLGYDDLLSYLCAQEEKQEGWTDGLLHAAARFGHVHATEMLIKHGISVKDQTVGGWTALHVAAEFGNIKVGQLLLEQGAQASSKSDNGLSPADLAARKGYLTFVDLLQPKTMGTDEASPDGRRTALHAAAEQGHTQLVMDLVGGSGEVDIKSDKGITPLYLASQNGHLATVEFLVNKHANVESKSRAGWTPLHAAASKGHTAVVDLLARRQANVNNKTDGGWTPLYTASLNGHVQVVQTLLSRGAKVNEPSDAKLTAIYAAAQRGHTSVVDVLLSHGADANSREALGWTPVHTASQHGHIRTVKSLVLHSAKVNARSDNGKSALFLASVYGQPEIAKFLLSNKAYVHARWDGGWTSLHVASQKGHVAIVEALISHGALIDVSADNSRTPLWLASRYGQVGAAKVLLSSKANADKPDNSGWTSLHTASEFGHLDVVKALISHGANINVQSNDKRTPLYLACWAGQLRVLDFLISSKADIETKKDGQWTPLHVAAETGKLDVAKLLIRHNACLDAVSNDKRTPMYLACSTGQLSMVDYLISSKASMTIRKAGGWTLLHIAAENGHLGVVKSLIERHGAQVDALSDNKRTPLHGACQNGHLAVVDLLLGSGANVNAASQPGWTPLHYAAEKGHSEVVKHLINKGHARVNEQNASRSTPLYIACNNGRTATVECLLTAGTDINLRRDGGWTPLHVAAENGHLAVVETLITKGGAQCQVHIRSNNDRTPADLAKSRGHTAVVEFLNRL